VLFVALPLLGGCHRVGGPPSWWWDDPVRDARYCKGRVPTSLEPLSSRKRSDIEAAVRSHLDGMVACYQPLLDDNPEVYGLLKTRLVIDKDGSAKAPCVASTTLNDDRTVACILNVFEKVNFGPAPRVVTIVYPVRFNRASSPEPMWLEIEEEDDFQLSRPPTYPPWR
jgi:hypothetical protein